MDPVFHMEYLLSGLGVILLYLMNISFFQLSNLICWTPWEWWMCHSKQVMRGSKKLKTPRKTFLEDSESKEDYGHLADTSFSQLQKTCMLLSAEQVYWLR